ncbi:MAG: hydroxyethylthiazole kinase [Desulfotalea sp.]
MDDLVQKTTENLNKIRSEKPLIHNITNFVVMNFTANALLASGASPVMAHAENEVEEMVSFARALVLNIGTLTDSWVDAMVKAGQQANKSNTPIILDPVGAGATTLRTRSAKRLINETSVKVIRGNSSEILALRNSNSKTKGVDSLHSVDEAAETATILAQELGLTLAITGEIDLVTDGKRTIRIANGHTMMPNVTGTGCAATAIIGAFNAVDNDPVTATATALAYYGLAGEKAARTSAGPGSFVPALMDALYSLSEDEIRKGCNFSIG